jgi:glyoxylase-like metal-dependent hydrolase (beta-lactamase superfamily II)
VRIHHLNCGTLRPLGGRLVNGDRAPFLPARLVCHCLLVETDDALVLVDTGFGLEDVERGRRGPAALAAAAGDRWELIRQAYQLTVTRPRLDAAETAARQVAMLGRSPGDVGHVVLTHLDLDHTGGLPDFPAARVHVLEPELRAATTASSPRERFRYVPRHRAHGPRWVTYPAGDGDRWFGFEGVRPLDGLPEIALVPLPGHTAGHAGVAIRRGGAVPWLLHAGDAYFFHGEVDPVAPRSTPGLAGFQARFEVDGAARRDTRRRLRELAGAHGDEVEMLCSHDPDELDRAPVT